MKVGGISQHEQLYIRIIVVKPEGEMRKLSL